jgi:structural maintenance of chromosome 2
VPFDAATLTALCVLQGRITKVINMKPEELRNMIEETAGTRMYEQKKQAAIKTIEKKQAKVDEINKVLAEEITPQLEKLRQERAEMIKFMSNSAECERLTRYCVAAEHAMCEDALKGYGSDMASLKAELAENQAAIAKATRELEEAEAGLERAADLRKARADGSHRALLDAKEEAGKEVVQRTSALQNKKKAIEEERKLYASLLQQRKSRH